MGDDLTMITRNVASGGSFLFDSTEADSIFIPEDITKEQQMMVTMLNDFIENEVLPHDEEIENRNYELHLELLRKTGELGILGADIPEEFGGLGLDKVTGNFISEAYSKGTSFAITLGTQMGIGSLPIVYFGTQEQKQRYLPSMATGEKVGAYCLTEPSSGSDALSVKTTAVLSEDGNHYIINGSKIFITNAAIADIFIVFAKVDGKHFSAFIVEKDSPGFTVGPEEKKMGIVGSSTCSLFFENVMVPTENLLGEIGKGHLIAFNILNIGRHKLPVSCLGNAKVALGLTSKYANERIQFGTPIAKFPVIGKKVAESNIVLYVLESMLYRLAGQYDKILKTDDLSDSDSASKTAAAISEYNIESSICKVFGSEALDFVVDEGVQIHGGYGYTKEYKIERLYRDSRINRIFEGTNEINRNIISSTIIKKATKNQLPLLDKILTVEEELRRFVPEKTFEGTLEKELYLESNAKKIYFLIIGNAMKKFEGNLDKQQVLLASLADIVIQIFAINSAILRTKKLISRNGELKTKNAIQMTQVFVQESFEKIQKLAKESASIIAEEGELVKLLSNLRNLSEYIPSNTAILKQEIADKIAITEKYNV